jgi:hypothetical protein
MIKARFQSSEKKLTAREKKRPIPMCHGLGKAVKKYSEEKNKGILKLGLPCYHLPCFELVGRQGVF